MPRVFVMVLKNGKNYIYLLLTFINVAKRFKNGFDAHSILKRPSNTDGIKHIHSYALFGRFRRKIGNTDGI